MKITFANNCAWRALYLNRADGWQVLNLGVDPNDGVKPEFFGGLHIRRKAEIPVRYLVCWNWRVRLPCVRWSHWYSRPRWLWRPAYRLSSWFWHKVDGRF